MKKKKLIIGFAIAVLIVVVVMEVFGWHPSFTIGRCQVHWDGLKHMSFHSVPVTNIIGGREERFTIYICGPITVTARAKE